jgi:TonB family protein
MRVYANARGAAMLALERLGKYELVEQIGEGGFGCVWLGRDPHLKRPVAIKTCESGDQDLHRRFLREAEIAAALHHPNIVVVHDFGYEDGIPYLVEEFLTGEDLSKIIARRQPVPLEAKLGWLIEVSRGLEFAHTHGVVHRDVKPSNVRILEDGSAKVLDFGIAKLAEGDTQHLTRTGTTIGTVGYMAPEQLNGEPIDFRADVFSFGVLAYELLSYTRPFEGDTVSRVFYRILNEDPPALTQIAADVPPALEQIVLRCLAKRPERRYGSFRTILDDLRRVATGEALDMDSTGDVTADLGRGRRPAPGPAAAREESRVAVPAAAPRPCWPPRALGRWILVAGGVALALGLLYLVLPSTPGTPAPSPEPLDVAPPAPTAAQLALDGIEPPPPDAEETVEKPARAAAERPRAPKAPEPEAPATEPEVAPKAAPPKTEPVPAEGAGPLLARAGPGLVLPRILERPSMSVPEAARRARYEGVVAVAVRVDETGTVTDVRPLGPAVGYGLDEATAEYARGCRWAPGTRDGVAAAMWTEFRVRYALDRR